MATAADILGLNRKTRIAPQWLGHYQYLCEERDRLIGRDFSGGANANAKLDDLADAAAEESERSMSFVAASATQGIIIEVIAAIQRIERGTYGTCEMTGEPIEAERLSAIPWTRYSLHGQDQLERRGYGRRPAIPSAQTLGEPIRLVPEEPDEEREEEAA